MAVVLFISVLSLMVGAALGAHDSEFNYARQDLWGGICNSGNMGLQSPINIITADVKRNPALTAIKFSKTWSEPTAKGVFSNTGHNIQFTLDSSSPKITTEFPIGQYRFLQAHMHWGRRTGTGSEHQIDGAASELEIHFVHKRVSSEGLTDRNGFSVIGVFADVDGNAPLEGFWKTFNPTQVQAAHDKVHINGFTLSSMLPPNLNPSDYYHYEGGLTTPPCTETVQFFLLKQKIKVPGAFLNAVRTITDDEGHVLSFNYRKLQAINGRLVDSPTGSDTTGVIAAVQALIAKLLGT